MKLNNSLKVRRPTYQTGVGFPRSHLAPMSTGPAVPVPPGPPEVAGLAGLGDRAVRPAGPAVRPHRCCAEREDRWVGGLNMWWFEDEVLLGMVWVKKMRWLRN